MSSDRVKVLVEVDEGETEAIQCVASEGDTYVVASIPALACGISVGDTLRATKTKAGLVADEIVGKSGRCTLSVFPDEKQIASVLARVKSLEGTSEVVDEEALAIDIPNDDALVLLTGWLDDAQIEYEVSDPLLDDDEDETDDSDDGAEDEDEDLDDDSDD